MHIVLLESLGVPQEVLAACARPLVEAGHTFHAYAREDDPQTQIARARDADVLMIANMPLCGEVISACPNLKFIDVAFTGVDHVDLEAARAKGIRVSNAAGYSTQAVAELAVCLMLSLLRNVPQVDERCRNGRDKSGLVGTELGGKTVGLIGVGAIGARTANLCRAFGCKVLGYKRHVRGDEPSFVEFVPLDELLARSDIVSLHCPLNDETRGIVSADVLARMKPTALLLNTARGALVDEAALADALNAGRLAGAGLDVLAQEPPQPGHPLLTAKNCLITPHIAWSSREARLRLIDTVAANLRAYLAGCPVNVVS